jgi:acetyl-CoA carboxylase carboxyl transferase alpha subunit/acetyl-CoA carboxylase carboxyl transferase beta subunit
MRTDLSGRVRAEPDTVTPRADWVSCPECRNITYSKRYARDLHVCSLCGHHHRITAPVRLEQLMDAGSVRPLPGSTATPDPLGFADRVPYSERLLEARQRTGLDDAMLAVRGDIEGHPFTAVAMDFRFFGGSLGIAGGDLITAAADAALRDRTPLLLITASGGARMQEGTLSLMQMARATVALRDLDQAGLLTVALVTDPTYGGVAASFATQTDVIIAEPGTHLGFAGPRVIEQIIGERLPPAFQTAESLRDRGLVDAVLPRSAQRETLAGLAGALRAADSPAAHPGGTATVVTRPGELPEREPWQVVQAARNLARPTTRDYARLALSGFSELCGDRHSADCPAIVGGIGRLAGRPVMLIGHQKGHTTRELAACTFGMASPAGYRKAVRLMRLAAKLGIPVVTLVDTPGAAPGAAAEDDGQAWAISSSLSVMADLPVPIVTVITGEGGSGGALALALANTVLCMENSVYSVISPEGCAAILWHDSALAPRAAQALGLDPESLLRLGVVDGVIREPAGGAQSDQFAAATSLRDAVAAELHRLGKLDPAALRAARASRFARFDAAGTSAAELRPLKVSS